ncbi:hypothetical protein BRC91_01325 [Halobacteriales archaeon QS_4_62_28]|nr:MAG: hypothetical protein BRC91_01325 [Halobacteriales archaeon QS_4_62_28]
MLPDLSQTINDIIGLVEWPATILLAVALPIIALLAVGPWVGSKFAMVADRVDFDEAIMETPFGGFFAGEDEVDGTIVTLITYLIVLIALVISLTLVNANQMANWVASGAGYFPSLIGGVLILLVGFTVAGYVSRSVKDNEVLGGNSVTPLAALTGRGVVYFVSVTLALDAFGYSTAILNTMAQAVAVGLGLGVALAIGISVGLGSQDYVAEHIEEWTN